MSVELLRKIVAKTLVGNVQKMAENMEDGAKKSLYRVYGNASGIKTGESNYGEWTGFLGTFEAITFNDDGSVDQQFASNIAFIQEPMESLLINALQKHDSVDFAIEVGIKADKALPRGYEYTTTPILEIQESDALDHLRKLALPAPSKKAAK